MTGNRMAELDLAEVRALHVPDDSLPRFCGYCGYATGRLPCDALVLADEVSLARTERDAYRYQRHMLREVLQQAVADCPVCGGTGELTEAVQAWGDTGAPLPRCHVCWPWRAVLEAG